MPPISKPPVPILADKYYDRPSAFAPENLLREARRQKAFPLAKCPPFACSIRTAISSGIFGGPGEGA